MNPYVILDVFTDTPLEGNALAVFPDAGELDPGLMQRTARELNLSETVFLMSPSAGVAADARARIFTPASELPFAGHPVLGSAFVVGEGMGVTEVRLQTGAGIVPVALRRSDAGEVVFGEMEQPIPVDAEFALADELLSALGLGSSTLPVRGYRNGPVHVYVGLPSADELAALRPDLGAVERLGALGVGCFAPIGASVWKSRNFAPGLGVPEDPATGSAAGPLALHLAEHGLIEFGQQIEIHQGVEIGRPSVLYARVDRSPAAIERVAVGGSAVVVARGEFLLPPG